MITEQSEVLRKMAAGYCDDLSRHPVLKNYWHEISLILKGSTARGNADQYSDIDFVFYAGNATREKIIHDYHAQGLTTRQDGIFMPLPDWIGHYHVESYEVLAGYFDTKNYPQVWECTHVVVMHDPVSQYQRTIDAGLSQLFADPLCEVKDHYLQLQLTLDWLRHPLKRGDKIAVLLHGAKIVKLVCELCYLFDRKPYPHDKWIFHYMHDTRWGSAHADLLIDYAEGLVDQGDMVTGLELEQYPQYRKAQVITQIIADFIASDYGSQAWLGEWYLYV